MSKEESRFRGRARDYSRYRPGYPVELATHLERVGLLPAYGVVADVAAGTGKLSALFLDRGHVVYGVEPNGEMRAAAERAFLGRENFHSVNGTAEATGLPAGSVDLVTVGQALHWFDLKLAREEFLRVLRPAGAVAVVWNEREEAEGFGAAYQRIVDTYKRERRPVSCKSITPGMLNAFFAPEPPGWLRVRQGCHYTLEGIIGRMRSSSYMPYEPDGAHDMIAALEKAFDAHAANGQVELEYQAVMCYGRFRAVEATVQA